MRLFHIATRAAWDAARAAGEYRPPSLASDGFIHLSTDRQWLAVANQLYRGQPDLVLVWIRYWFEPEVKFERVDGELFPHLYGPLRLIDGLDESFIVMNGDVLTTIDYADLLRHHSEAGNALTIATRERAIKIDYGVLHIENRGSPDRIVRFVEKPELQSTVSMGIYVFEPSVLDYVPEDRHFDFPELVQALLADDEQVGAYPFDGVWFDIGREDDYARAAEEWDRRGSVNGANGNGNGNGKAPASAADRSAAGSMS